VEPSRQIEIQLGHMCNNRCVFCVSGQSTAMGEAGPMPAEPILARLRDARAEGIGKLTLLGGEPTLQPEFFDVVRGAVELGFDEVVIFTNGVKTARPSYVDEVLALGGGVLSWRISLQGATGAAHDRTTRKLGAFQRIRASLANLAERGQRVSVNMCVVRSNYESVEHFPGLLLPYGVRQLHLDMMRPLDAGQRTEDEMRAMLPRYSDMVPSLARMVAGFPAGFDVNIGNLPYCVAPELAHVIHHDGQHTLTVAVDSIDTVSEPWDKYRVKRRDKVKPPRCATCVFDPQCSGVFETYQRFYGLDEFQPVTRERLVRLDPRRRLFNLHIAPAVARLRDGRFAPPAPFGPPDVTDDTHDAEVRLRFEDTSGRGSAVLLAARRPDAPGACAATDDFSLHLLEADAVPGPVLDLLRAVFATMCDAETVVRHPPAVDAGCHGPRARALASGSLDARIAACLARLRARAPFGALRWTDVALDTTGRAAVVSFADGVGTTVDVTLAVRDGGIAGGYRLGGAARPSPALAEGVRAVMDALRTPV
jgi:MoaA/NifB/PqqE/SkfB family radical SAM enzyme